MEKILHQVVLYIPGGSPDFSINVVSYHDAWTNQKHDSRLQTDFSDADVPTSHLGNAGDNWDILDLH